MKLAAGRYAQAEFVLILDAKNHFLREVSHTSFVSAAGRPKCNPVLPNSSQLRYIEASFRRMGATTLALGSLALPTVTPFCVARDVLCSSLDALEREVGPVETFFARKRTAETEFMIIYAHVVASRGGVLAAFDPGLLRRCFVTRRSRESILR